MKTIIFDLDGVITDTASVHYKAWKYTFDKVLDYLLGGQDLFKLDDYHKYVDGRVRLEGVKTFLEHKNLTLPIGNEKDCGLDTFIGVGNFKNRVFLDIIKNEGVDLFDDALFLLLKLKQGNANIGLGTASKNAVKILEVSSLDNYFNFIMDGLVAQNYGVNSKPDGEFYTYACKMANRNPLDCVVIEDSISGIQSAKAAGIGQIIGVARSVPAAQLFQSGADRVVNSLTEIQMSELA